MKGLKAVLGIALSVSGLGTAVALGAASVAPTNEVAKVEATSISSKAKLYRFTNNENWANVYVHAWGSSNSSSNTSWPGLQLTSYSFNSGRWI